MRLVTFKHRHGPRLGVLVVQDGREVVVDVQQAAPTLPADMLSFLRRGPAGRSAVAAAVAHAPAAAVYDVSAVALKAVVPNPGKIICIGLNYRDHAIEVNLPIPTVPTVFAKYTNTLIGHGEAIVIPRVTRQVDYEAELAVVIGRRGRSIPEDAALDYVAGYTIFNDVSGRDYQMQTSQWTMGKTFDTFGPLGPVLVTADALPDPHNLDIRLTIGDETLQASNTRELIFTIPALIAFLSRAMSLEPGDVIATGTPAGVGFTRTPPRFLQPGEVVQVEIEQIGVLANPVVSEGGGTDVSDGI